MEFASALIFGVITGTLYGLAALGIVLVYRVSRVLNFAIVGTAGITSYEASTLLAAHWPYVVVVVVALASGAALSAVCYWILSLAAGAGVLAVGVGSIGLLLAMQGIVGVVWGPQQRVLALPFSGTITIGGITISDFEIMAVGLSLVSIFLTFLLVYRTQLGLRMRAVSAGPRTAELLGTNRRSTEVWVWMLGGAAGSLAGLLIVPLFGLDQTVIINFSLAAFAAVAIGGFTSLGGVLLAGVTMSVAVSLLATFVSSLYTNTFTLLLIAFALFFRPSGLFGMGEREVSEPRLPPRRALAIRGGLFRRSQPRWVARLPVLSTTISVARRRVSIGHLALTAGVAAALIYGFAMGGTTSYVFATALAMFISVLGVDMITGQSGQVSLGQGAFVGLGAYSSGVVSVHLNAPVWFALPIALGVGAVVGLVVGWPAARLSGVYLVVFTLAFGLAVPELLLNSNFMGASNGLLVSAPTFLESGRYQFLVAAAVAIAAAAGYAVVSRSQLGRRWRAVRDSEMGVASLGWSPTVNKVTAFALGSSLTALGGALAGILTGFVSPGDYSVFLSIYLIVALILGGPGTIIGCLVGALVITLLPYYVAGSNVPEVIFGIALVLILIVAPEGIANRLMRQGFALGARRPESPNSGMKLESDGVPQARIAAKVVADRHLEDGSAALKAPLVVDNPILDIQGLTVAYAGGPVLQDVSIRVGHGDAVAVVGANGAGKSTLLRAISGWVLARDGRIMLNSKDIVGFPAYEVARLGIAHVPEGRCVFPGLTVLENLRLGYRREAGKEEEELLSRVLQLFPKLKQRLRQDSGSMSGGEQQMLAVGRGLMAAPQVLLLDEPSLGLAPVVIDEMFQAFLNIIDGGVSVLIVEQNVHTALSFANRGYVMSRGECVMHETASDLAAHKDLISAFLVPTEGGRR